LLVEYGIHEKNIEIKINIENKLVIFEASPVYSQWSQNDLRNGLNYQNCNFRKAIFKIDLPRHYLNYQPVKNQP